MKFTLYVFLAISLLTCEALSAQERTYGKGRSIEKISEHVYRWGSDRQYGAYIVGADGIAVVDGHYCQSGTVAWLKQEIAKRHEVPVRYVILSHDHRGHICNSQLFADTAIGIGHKNIVPHIIRENRSSIIPSITFEESIELDLGGVRLHLFYLGPSHSDNLIQIHIPEEKVLIAIDIAKGRSLFPDYRDSDVNSLLDVLSQLERWPDVETVLPGHGPATNQANFTHQRRYLQALRDAVLEQIIAGRSLQQIRDSVTMDEFSDYRFHKQFLDANIVTMWDYLYRYREPNRRLTERETVDCVLDATRCRTGDETP